MEKLKLDINKLIAEKTREVLKKHGVITEKKANPPEGVITEAQVVTQDYFVIKTEKLSKRTIEAHEALYKKYVDTFNKISSELDAANKQDANSNYSAFRSLKRDECENLNAIKLHELYFDNISDLASQIGLDSLPYIKLSRCFGTFENFQFDFMACALSARDGWVVTVFEPYKNIYMNVCVDGDGNGIPLGCVPVIVIDMAEHAYYRDYDMDKKTYLIGMMRELNWSVIEARMIVAEQSNLNAVYSIKPTYNDDAGKLLKNVPDVNAPIDKVMGANGVGSVSPSTPASLPPPTTNMNNLRG